MDINKIAALIDILLEEKLNDSQLPVGPKGSRGPRGFDGEKFNWEDHSSKILHSIKENSLTFSKLTDSEKESLRGPVGLKGLKGSRGEDGRDGKDFKWSDYEEKIYNRIDSNKLKFKDFTEDEIFSLRGEKGSRGQKGRSGDNGQDGIAGKDFSWEEHVDRITELISSNKIKFSDLTEDEKIAIQGERGLTGKKGVPGRDFIWEDHKEEILDKSKLHFTDLSASEKESLIGEQGLTGRKGTSGKNFDWEEHKEEIFNNSKIKFSDLSDKEKSEIKGESGLRGLKGLSGRDGESFSWDKYKEEILSKSKFRFSDFSEEEKLSLKGSRGLRGQKGKPGINGSDGRDGESFVWNDHEKKIFEKISNGKLTFEDFSDVEKESLKGERGSRGQRGKLGESGESAYELWAKENDGSEFDFLSSLVGKTGVPGIAGLKGIPGQSVTGADGKDGSDASEIVDIKLLERDKGFYFKFIFSDGTFIETKSILKPQVNQIIQQTIYSSGGSGDGGGGASVLEVYKDNILVGLSESLNFEGDNINVTYNSTTKQTTISVDEKCIPVSDEGIEVTNCLNGMDFVGDGVTVTTKTVMANWPTLADVTTLAGYESVNPGFLQVEINKPESTSKLGLTRIASEDIAQFQMVRLVSSTHVAIGSNDTALESKISGIAINSALAGEEVTFIMFGIIEDASFSFPLLVKLFLNSDGTLGVNPPAVIGKSIVVSGESLGSGAIFIKIQEPELIA